MKIIMLGHSGVGKTSYLAAMYHQMNSGVGGFSVRSTSKQHHRELKRMGQRLVRGDYPDASAQRREYEFELDHKQTGVTIGFTWSDYRGGALMEKATESQTARLLKDLADASAILVFADSVALVDPSGREKRRIRRLNTLVTHALKDRDEPVLVGIVLTKTDLLPGHVSESDLTAAFSTLIDAIARNNTVFGAVMPVAVGEQRRDVADPPIFCIAYGIGVYLQMLKANTELQKAVAIHLAAGDTMLAKIKQRWKGELTDTQQAQILYYEAIQQLEYAEPLVYTAEQLLSELDHVYQF